MNGDDGHDHEADDDRAGGRREESEREHRSRDDLRTGCHECLNARMAHTDAREPFVSPGDAAPRLVQSVCDHRQAEHQAKNEQGFVVSSHGDNLISALCALARPVRMTQVMARSIQRHVVLLPLVAGLVLVASCGGSRSSYCSGVKSVAGFVSQFSQGLDNFSEDRYAQLRLDALDALDTAGQSTEDAVHGEDASALVTRLRSFVNAMDDVSWDVSQALENRDATEAAAALGTPEALVEANSVESVVISRCGLPTTIPPIVESDTLPFPSLPAPTETDPATNGPNEDSESLATGQMVAMRFGLTLRQAELVCLGRELQNVFDDGSADEGSTKGMSLYQSAFDTCGINFTVPKD